MATYMQVYGDALVAINGWDVDVLRRFQNDDVVSSILGAIDALATSEQLEHIKTLESIPGLSDFVINRLMKWVF